MNRYGLMVVALAALMAGALQAGAGGAQDRTRTKDQKRDGSCQTTVSSTEASTATSPDRIRARLRDGSCQSTDGTTPIRDCLRLRDGSCRSR